MKLIIFNDGVFLIKVKILILLDIFDQQFEKTLFSLIFNKYTE